MIFKRENRKFYVIFLLFISFSYSFYEIGDTISLEDQNIEYDICYGDYEADKIKLSNFNGNINSTNFMVTGLLIQATW